MPYRPALPRRLRRGRHEQFIIAISIIATLSLPLFSYASVENTFKNASNSFIVFGAKIDQTISFTASLLRRANYAGQALPSKTARVIATTIDSAANTITTAVEDTAENAKAHASFVAQRAKEEMTHATSMAEVKMSKIIKRQHSMLNVSAKAFMATAERSVTTGKHRMLGAKEAAHKEITHYKSYVSSLAQEAKEDTLALLSSLQSSHNSPNPSYLKRGTQKNFPEESSQTLPLKVRGTEGVIPIKIIERIIERVSEQSPPALTISSSLPSPSSNPSSLTPSSQDPRINSLITNLADLTSRVDGGNAGGSSAPSNAALFNMISQFQRIKTLDDVKITNATIEGYVTGTTLSNYLLLSGGTLTGGLTGTSLSLSTTLSVTSVLNASSTTHFTATSTFGNLIRIEGTGTSTILGRLSILATSTMAGYKICTAENNVCAGGAFTSSGGFSTLRTATDLVGLGTSTPSEKLSLNGGVYFDSDIIRYGSSSAPTLNFRYFASSTSTIPNLTSAFTYATSTTNTPLLTLSTKPSRYGRVGIGTSTPSALFAINALNSSNQADNIFYIGSSTQNTFVVDNHGNVGVGTSSPRSRLTIDGGLGAYFSSSGLLGLGTTTPWKSSTLSIEQNGVNPLLTLGDTGTTTPFLMVTGKGIISFGSSSPILLNPSDLVIGRNGVTNDAYISGGLGIGNATTTDGILETSGLGYIGGVLKVKGTGTSTFSNGIQMLGGCYRTLGGNCLKEVVTIRKTADEIVNNSATLQDDDQLFLAMAANETWYFTLNFAHVGNSTADFKYTFTIPTGASFEWGCAGMVIAADATTIHCNSGSVSGSTETMNGDTTAKHHVLIGSVINGSTAGNLQFQWAQNTATAVDTKVLANSYLEAHK